MVFGRLRQCGLKMKACKCFLVQTEASFLGHRVHADGVSSDPAKVDCVANWRTVNDVCSFLGTTKYCRKFIDRFVEISAPLVGLIRKDSRFVWTDACEVATLKERLTLSPVLLTLDGLQVHFWTQMTVVLGQVQFSLKKLMAIGG